MAVRAAAILAGCVIAAAWAPKRQQTAPRARYSAARALEDTARITAAMARLDPAMARLRLVCEPDPRGMDASDRSGERRIWHVYGYDATGREAQFFLWDTVSGKLLMTHRNGTHDDVDETGQRIRISPVGAVVAARTWCRLLYGFTEADDWQAVGAPSRRGMTEFVQWRTRAQSGRIGVHRCSGTLTWASLDTGGPPIPAAEAGVRRGVLATPDVG